LGISEARGNQGIVVTRKVKRDLLKKSRADIPGVEGRERERGNTERNKAQHR
jgi:hypothetical protein